MRPDPNELVKSIYGFLSEELKLTTTRYYEFGKYALTVSAGTATFVAVAKQIFPALTYDPYLFVISMLLLAGSLVFSVLMVIPREWNVGPETEIEDQLRQIVAAAQSRTWGWFWTWLLGLAFGLASFYRLL